VLRTKLRAAREKRIRPGWDDKVLADWNGLMIAALARAGIVFDRPSWVTMAARAFTFVTEKMTVADRLLHSVRNGTGGAPATATDYANMIWSALRLYQATGEAGYLEQAIAWVDVLDTHYWSSESGGYFTAADDTRDVIVRLKTASDDATPNANATMLTNLAALGTLTGEARFVERAEAIMRAFSADLSRNLSAHTGLMAAALDLLAPQLIVLVEGYEQPGGGLKATLRGLSLPGAIELLVKGTVDERGPPAVRGKSTDGGKTTAYACLGPQCSLPVTDAESLRQLVIDQRSLA
jgi:uncharacterized protein YyaL (SSP411 family)